MSDEELVLFECDPCANREWRPRDQEPWLCVVCGYYRWRIVSPTTDQPEAGHEKE